MDVVARVFSFRSDRRCRLTCLQGEVRRKQHDASCVVRAELDLGSRRKWFALASNGVERDGARRIAVTDQDRAALLRPRVEDRKSTRLNSSHSQISYAVFCLKKKKKKKKKSKKHKTRSQQKIKKSQ